MIYMRNVYRIKINIIQNDKKSEKIGKYLKKDTQWMETRSIIIYLLGKHNKISEETLILAKAKWHVRRSFEKKDFLY